MAQRLLKLRLINTTKERFYDIRICHDGSIWTTLTTFGRIGHDGTTVEIFSGTSQQNAVLAGERFQNKKQTEGYVKILGTLRRD